MAMKCIGYYVFIVVGIVCVVSACKQSKQADNVSDEEKVVFVPDDRIDTIYALFYNYQIESSSPIDPESITKNIPDFEKESYHGVVDATISDTAKIRKIKDQLDLLKKAGDNNFLPDARIVLKIKHKDGTYSHLALCGDYADQIYYNKNLQEPNNKLVFYIKNYIGYYPWFIGDGLFSMPELNDSSFPKEPFVSSDYYKEYQKALAAR